MKKTDVISGKIEQSATDRTRDSERIRELAGKANTLMDQMKKDSALRMSEQEKEHQSRLTEMKRKHNEEMEAIEKSGQGQLAEIQRKHDEEIRSLENTKKENLKNAPLMVRVAMGDPEAIKLAKQKTMSAEEILEDNLNELKSKDNLTDKEKETLKILESVMRYKKQSEGGEGGNSKFEDELKKKDAELEVWREEERKKDDERIQKFESMIKRTEEFAEKTKKEAIDGIQQEQMRICEKCGGMTRLKDKHCRLCGSKQEELKYCEKCKQYRTGNFCGGCGSKLI